MIDPRSMTCAEVEELAGIYVLGALEDDEAAVVAAHLADCPEAHATFAELAAAGSSLAASVEPRDTPPALRARVLETIATTPRSPAGAPQERARAEAVEEAHRQVEGPWQEPLPAPPWHQRLLERWSAGGAQGHEGLTALGVAAAAIALLFVGAGIVGSLRLATDEVARLDLLRRAVAAAAQPGTSVAVLTSTGTGAAADATGYAVFPSGEDAYIVVDGLDPIGPGETYQAWLVGEGAPVSAGLLELSADGLGTLTGLRPSVEPAIVALTVEQLPGAEAPTMDPIIAGEVRGTTA